MKRFLIQNLCIHLFWIRVNEHFTSPHYYRKNAEKYKICQVVHPVNPSTIIETKQNFINNQYLVII